MLNCDSKETKESDDENGKKKLMDQSRASGFLRVFFFFFLNLEIWMVFWLINYYRVSLIYVYHWEGSLL